MPKDRTSPKRSNAEIGVVPSGDVVERTNERFNTTPSLLVMAVGLIIGFIVFLATGVLVINRFPQNPDQPVIESPGPQPQNP